MNTNIILATDSYKLNHWNQYPKGTETVYSYFESRPGAEFPYTVFYGLQYLLKKLEGSVVRWDDISEARAVADDHFGNNQYFNYAGWVHIMEKHGGRLPLRIKAVPEGTPVPTDNVLMTVENTDPKCFWLTNAVESLLTHVWYPSTVATLSRTVKEDIVHYMKRTGDPDDLGAVQFMLHDFGYRGASSDESAAIGGSAHLVNFVGTDTVPALVFARDFYNADLTTTGFSVAATEHSVMTSLGREGEFDIVDNLLDEYPTGILSVVADSYNVYQFVTKIGTEFKERILARDGVFVVRPDSVTKSHPTPAELVVWIAHELAQRFGTTVNTKGCKVIDSHIRILWGDGLDPRAIHDILVALEHEGFSAANIATFGMGGGLLQKVNRDTQRFAFKSSAQKRNGEWHDIFKDPVDSTKKSKKGRLQLSVLPGRGDSPELTYHTLAEGTTVATTMLADDHPDLVQQDLLETVFEDGKIVKEYSFDEVRERAKL